MNKKIILFICLCCLPLCLSAQKWALKSNLLYDATATVNLGVEMKIGKTTTLDVPLNLNAWKFSEEKRFKHFLVQPEFRWWTCEPFTGHFFGVHAHYGIFNVGGISPITIIKDNRHEGWLAGVGVSYGYNWLLDNRWSLEATIGLGYAYIDSERYQCGECGQKIRDDKLHYFGPTKVGLTLVFMIK